MELNIQVMAKERLALEQQQHSKDEVAEAMARELRDLEVTQFKLDDQLKRAEE